MSQQQRKQSFDDVFAIFLIIFFIIFAIDYLLYNSILIPCKSSILYNIALFLYKFQSKLMILRILYIITALLFIWNSFNYKVSKKITNNNRYLIRILAIITIPIVIIGYINNNENYNLIIYPLIFFANLSLLVFAINSFKKRNLDSESILDNISQIETDFSFRFPTKKGELIVHTPHQHIYVEGGPGSGKSQSILKPIIKQVAEKGIPGLIYDFEGDPLEIGAPILGRIAYTALKESKEINKDIKTNFSFINFTDMGKTVRVNPFSERYITDRLYVQDLVQNLMTNLSVNKGKSDFWEKYGTAYIYGISWMVVKNYKEIASLPLIISIALNDINLVLKWCETDNDSQLIMAPLISAWKNNALQQLAGAETSAQLPISILLDPKIFWVLSKDEFDLDITNKNNPYLLCIGNSKKFQQALAPVISVLLTSIMKQMNSPGKAKSVFCFDEFPTVKANGIDIFIATIRKHYCSVILALQDFTQAERDYSKDNASILRTSCGNHFYGMTGNLNTAKYVSSMLGEIKKESISYSTSHENISTSESLQREKVLQERDIMGQNIGHFTGKIAGGKPPYFSVQFDEFKYEDKDIPSFAYKYDVGNEEMNKKIIDKLVEENYYKIIDLAKEIITSSKN